MTRDERQALHEAYASIPSTTVSLDGVTYTVVADEFGSVDVYRDGMEPFVSGLVTSTASGWFGRLTDAQREAFEGAARGLVTK